LLASEGQDIAINGWRIDVADEKGDVLSDHLSMGFRMVSLVGGALV
jgi:hypothetical protein